MMTRCFHQLLCQVNSFRPEIAQCLYLYALDLCHPLHGPISPVADTYEPYPHGLQLRRGVAANIEALRWRGPVRLFLYMIQLLPAACIGGKEMSHCSQPRKTGHLFLFPAVITLVHKIHSSKNLGTYPFST